MISYEPYENAPPKQDVMASAMAGNILAGKKSGAYGAYLAASHAKDVNNSLNTFEVWITVKDGNSPIIRKAIIGNPSGRFERNGNKHQEYVGEFKRFDAYMNSNQTLNQPVILQNALKEESVKMDSVEEIRKYKNLFDDGIISQKEFELKKKQLLGI